MLMFFLFVGWTQIRRYWLQGTQAMRRRRRVGRPHQQAGVSLFQDPEPAKVSGQAVM